MKPIKKSKIFLIINFILFSSKSNAASLKSKEVIHERLPPGNCSALEVKGRLTNTAKIDHIGIIEIVLPNIEKPLSVCFPGDEYQHQHAAILSHILCRQLGYMTVGSSYMEGHPVGDEQFSVAPDGPGCIGHEQSLSHCCWNKISTEYCRNILGIRCQSCFKKMVSSTGVIFSPGYPNAYFYSVFCEWHIIVSAGHTIEIVFNHFHLPSNKQYVYCDTSSPHIEVIYQIKAGYTSKRYCNNNYVDSLSIPFKEARIRFFSGFYNGMYSEMGKNYGMSASFKAKLHDSASHFKSLIISCVVIVLFVLMMAWYLCIKWKHYKKRQVENRINATGPNAPGLDALNAAYEFQRVQIQTAKSLHSESDTNTNSSADMSKSPAYENLPVAALAPLGPRFRKISSYGTTPRTVIPEILEMQENNPHNINRSYLSRLKTRLLSRFSTSTVNSSEDSQRDESDCSVFLPRPVVPFEIYRSCSSGNEEEQPPSTAELSGITVDKSRKESQVSTTSGVFNKTYDVPSIVIQAAS